MFRRRRREEVAEPEVREDEVSEDLGPDDEETWDDAGDEAAPPGAAVEAAEAAEAAWGPWDAADDIPPLNRVDFGSLRARLGQNGVQEKLTKLWIDRSLQKLGLRQVSSL